MSTEEPKKNRLNKKSGSSRMKEVSGCRLIFLIQAYDSNI